MPKKYQKHADGPWSYPIDTSEAAADAIADARPVIEAMVLTAVKEAGPKGVTVVETATKIGKDRMGVQPRFSELRVARKIVDSGMRRKNPSGVGAIVWVLPEFVGKPEGASQ